MDCIIHIGTEKTGTTAIQSFLDTNRELLRSHGVLFTKSAGRKTNRMLSVAAYHPSRRDEFTRRLGLSNEDQLVKLQEEVVADLKKEIDEAKGVKTVIFSSEHCHSRLRTDEEVGNLYRILKGYSFERIKVVVYLREQVDTICSLYSTAVLKGARKTLPPGPFDEEYWTHVCDHKNALQRYQRVFGADAVVPRIFSRDSFYGGSIVLDLMNASGLDIPIKELEVETRENASISALGLEVLRKLNEHVPVFFECGKMNSNRLLVEQIFRYSFTEGAKFRLSHEMACEYREAFAESNEWVRSEFFAERDKLFTGKEALNEKGLNFDDHQIDQLVGLFRSILENAIAGTFVSNRRLPKLILRRMALAGRAVVRKILPS